MFDRCVAQNHTSALVTSRCRGGRRTEEVTKWSADRSMREEEQGRAESNGSSAYGVFFLSSSISVMDRVAGKLMVKP